MYHELKFESNEKDSERKMGCGKFCKFFIYSILIFFSSGIIRYWHDDVMMTSFHPIRVRKQSYLGQHCCALHHSNQIWNRPRHKLNSILMENWIILLFNIQIYCYAIIKDTLFPIEASTDCRLQSYFQDIRPAMFPEWTKAHSRLKIQTLYPNFNGTILSRVFELFTISRMRMKERCNILME